MSIRESKKRDGYNTEEVDLSGVSSKPDTISEFMAVLDSNEERVDGDSGMSSSTNDTLKTFRGMYLKKKFSGLTTPILAVLTILCLYHNSTQDYTSKSSHIDSLSNEVIQGEDYTDVRRTLSVNLGGGDCLWTNSKQADQSKPLFTSLVVAYPGSGKRTTFLNLEGLTELVSGDDWILRFEPPETKYAFMKTAYPQHHGTWGWEDRSHQALLIVRNPRWALVNFHHMLYEIDFSDSWIKSYQHVQYTYTKRTPLEDWAIFRDLRFDHEIRLWGWLIDFWMEGGLLRSPYTNEMVDEETWRMALQPHIYTEAELMAMPSSPEPYYDPHCINDIQNGCVPTEVVSFERILSNSTGPAEIAKLAATIQGKPGISMIEEEARECVWWEMANPEVGGQGKTSIPHHWNRDNIGPDEEEFLFTKPQMEKILEELYRVRAKYSEPDWVGDANAEQLVQYFNVYIAEDEAELATM